MRVRVRGGQRERGVGRGGERRRGQRRGPVRRRVSDDIRATLVDHVINHGLSMREAGQRVHPNLSRYTVASIIRTWRLENRLSIFFITAFYVGLPCLIWAFHIVHLQRKTRGLFSAFILLLLLSDLLQLLLYPYIVPTPATTPATDNRPS
ncbi:hypothetical protein QQF64_020471 [Cirrhinus molitorella]|uniref:Uncharacterized protein n=1 Tax=Cirrhinus molitorella TaxID=172907 RepID=A0ABR3LBL8_9TELE